MSSLQTMSERKILNEIVQRKALIGINSPIGAAVVDPLIRTYPPSGVQISLYNQLCDDNKSFFFIDIQMRGRVMIMEFIYRHFSSLSGSPGEHKR